MPSSRDEVISELEAIFIEVLEPPQNRRRGDDLGGFEFLQETDPELEKRQKREIIKKLQSPID